MKNPVIKIALISFVAVLFIAACKSPTSDTPAAQAAVTPVTGSLPAAPAAVAVNDNSVNGVYKGVITDTVTSGSFWISIADDTANPSVISRAITGLTAKKAALNVLLITTAGVDQRTVAGTATAQPDGRFKVSFTWTTNSVNYVMTYTISSSGVVSLSTPPAITAGGTPIGVNLAKETTVVTVESWVGTISGSSSGTKVVNNTPVVWTADTNGNWNFIRTGNTLSGSWSANTVNSFRDFQPDIQTSGSISGTVNGNTITFGGGVPDKTCTGTFSGSSVGGSWSWKASDKGSGSWSGSKKL